MGRAADRVGQRADWLDQLPTAAAVLSPDGRALQWNAAAAEIFGWTRQFPPPRLAPSHASWFERLRGQIAHEGRGRALISRRSGRGRVFVEVTARAREDGTLVGLFRDCTADVRGRRARHLVEQRLRLLSDTVPDHAVITLDRSGRISRWSGTAQRLTGHAADDVARRPFRELLEGSEAELDSSESMATVERADGSTFRARLTVSPVTDHHGEAVGYGVVVRDLTEPLRAEERLRRSEEELRHAQKMEAVGRLAAGIAHDFNNLLTAIHGHVQFLLDDLPLDMPSREDALEVKRAAERATELTRQLLTFARRQPMQPVELDVRTVITDIEKLLRRLIRADLELEKSLEEVPRILADPGLLEQVLVNLVVNARDAIPGDGTITIATSAMFLDETYTARDLELAPGDYVQITVTDTGCGMSEEVQRHVFEPFFTTKKEGTGLGLSTVYGIVKQSGGHLSVYSELGIGTTFKVFLPALEDDATRHPAHVSHTVTAMRSPAVTVLLVDDDDEVRALARRTLESEGYVIVEAANGAEALEQARRLDEVDALVTDITMPEMDGGDLVEQLRHLHPHARAVIMSGFPRTALLRDGRLPERLPFLEKPFSPVDLVDAVSAALRR